MLVYISLLETVETILTVSLRIPALPAMLLFSHARNINMSMERLVRDSWLEVKFAVAVTAQIQLLAAVTKLREYRQELLDLKLSDTTDTTTRKLSRGIVLFLQISVVAT
jgi:hypothetical protein